MTLRWFENKTKKISLVGGRFPSSSIFPPWTIFLAFSFWAMGGIQMSCILHLGFWGGFFL